jgi:hypothetical protein
LAPTGQRLGEEFGDSLILDGARPAAAQFIVQARQAVRDEAVAPLADRVRADAKIDRHRFVAGLALARQDNARALRQSGRQASRARHRQKLGAFLVADRQCALRPSASHRISPFMKIPESKAIFMSRIFGTEH